MAFLTLTNIQSELPNGFNPAQAERLLVKIESQLQRLGFVFVAVNETTREFYADRFGQRIFDFGYARDITAVGIVDINGATVFTFGAPPEYRLVEHPNIAGLFYRVELTTVSIREPFALQFTGRFGIYVDFADTTSFETRLLRSSVIDYIIKYLSVYSSQPVQAMNIKSASTGESKVTYGDAGTAALMNFHLEEDFDFGETIKHFVLPSFI